jgi:imidazoleglycerol-phosphate dehydratase/histidinol-phosphatase
VIGDRESDILLAKNMGLAGYQIGPRQGVDTWDWPSLAKDLCEQPRRALVDRKTNETSISISVNLDGTGQAQISSGLGFFDHMLDQVARHGGIDLEIMCRGDLKVDEHHTVEDTALALGEALRKALGDKVGIERYGWLLPMDEAQAQVALDLSGRPFFIFEGNFPRSEVGGLPTELIPHFFKSLSDSLGMNLQMKVQGENTHHMVESLFKAFARALRSAVARSRDGGMPSTKGTLL